MRKHVRCVNRTLRAVSKTVTLHPQSEGDRPVSFPGSHSWNLAPQKCQPGTVPILDALGRERWRMLYCLASSWHELQPATTTSYCVCETHQSTHPSTFRVGASGMRSREWDLQISDIIIGVALAGGSWEVMRGHGLWCVLELWSGCCGCVCLMTAKGALYGWKWGLNWLIMFVNGVISVAVLKIHLHCNVSVF